MFWQAVSICVTKRKPIELANMNEVIQAKK
jgi:hypothetical protein